MLKRGKDGDHLSHMFKSKQLRMAFKAFQCQASKEAVGVKNTAPLRLSSASLVFQGSALFGCVRPALVSDSALFDCVRPALVSDSALFGYVRPRP
ncbi:hypothetical protein J1605_006154 [Eschrichtius robustus]|uniref:Uncharacterized protein n=1 Tax=Eschrichtius robustus TaxID=9764 RepID=A0AB34H6W3_ESCRO|nr:hypothetical protein J1605_006154 [Eschrichtius robustus]